MVKEGLWRELLRPDVGDHLAMTLPQRGPAKQRKKDNSAEQLAVWRGRHNRTMPDTLCIMTLF